MTILTFQAYVANTAQDEFHRCISVPKDFQHLNKERRVRKIGINSNSTPTNLWMELYYGSVLMGKVYIQQSSSIASITNAEMKPHSSALVCPKGEQILLKLPQQDGTSRQFLIAIDQEELA